MIINELLHKYKKRIRKLDKNKYKNDLFLNFLEYCKKYENQKETHHIDFSFYIEKFDKSEEIKYVLYNYIFVLCSFTLKEFLNKVDIIYVYNRRIKN